MVGLISCVSIHQNPHPHQILNHTDTDHLDPKFAADSPLPLLSKAKSLSFEHRPRIATQTVVARVLSHPTIMIVFLVTHGHPPATHKYALASIRHAKINSLIPESADHIHQCQGKVV
jgi:hypothetical protein